jgi:hypothetical protein
MHFILEMKQHDALHLKNVFTGLWEKKDYIEEEDMSKRFLVLIALLMLGFYIAGCAEGDNSDSVVNPNPNVFAPTGSISGVVFDSCKLLPVQGATVSVAYLGKVHSVVTGKTGAFSFANVPANDDYGDAYQVTCDLTTVTSANGVYGYALVETAFVEYNDLGDGYNEDEDSGEFTESGSGASTPVNGLNVSITFDVSELNASISGIIYDVSTGRALTGAAVSLFLGGNFFATTTASASGAYTFDNIPATSGYSLLVTKAGYDYANLQSDIISQSEGDGGPFVTVSCGQISLTCSPGCNQDLAGVDVNMIANPAKDMTVPYIVSVAGGGETDIIDEDDFPSLTNTDFTSLVVTFSEAMATGRSLKNAVDLSSDFSVTVSSSGGTNLTRTISMEIIDSWTVTMTSSGVMTLAITYVADADIIDAVLATAPALPWDADAATLAIGDGEYELDISPSPHLTDASFIPWSIGTPGELDALGFLHAFGEAYQDSFILDPTGSGAGELIFYVND